LSHSVPAGHPPQVEPPAPQEPFDWAPYASQVPVRPPLQQPFGHEAASQTHRPDVGSHASPAGQGAHAAPAGPQDALDSFASSSHVEPLQQPAHAPPPQLQPPLVQLSPAPHGAHVAPAVPHELSDCAL
jgi:hypothetical protein